MGKSFFYFVFIFALALGFTPTIINAQTPLSWPGNLFSLPAATGKASPLVFSIGKIFSENTVYALNQEKMIYGVSVTAVAHILSPDSLILIVLVDKNNNEYLVYEGYSNLNGRGDFSISNFCDETCYLGGVIPVNLKIYLNKASVDISSLTFQTAPALALKSSNFKNQQVDYKVASLNQKIKTGGGNWTAGRTSVSDLSYSQKKKLFTAKDGKIPDSLPNLQGFEYYKGGIFELKRSSSSAKGASIVSNIVVPDSYDWRTVNGENWMTSVKNQGETGNCLAFATVGALESQINLYYNQHLNADLSEQLLVDCGRTNSSVPALIEGLTGMPESCSSQSCYAGDNYCKIGVQGITDEGADPYSQRDRVTVSPHSACFYPNVASNWSERLWRMSDFHDYYLASSNPTPNCPKQTLNLSEDETKKLIIQKGPTSSGLNDWGHAMVLLGYNKDKTTGVTSWVFKNSWGSNWGDNGYAQVVTSLDNMSYAVLPIGPFSPPANRSYWPAGFDNKAKCVDKDNDSYCNWGISAQPSDVEACPKTCKKNAMTRVLIKDCNDNSSERGPFISSINLNCAVISAGAAPSLVATNSILEALPNNWAKLQGTNLSERITVSGATYPVLSPRLLNGGQRVDFKIDPREKPGTYEVYVTNSAGQSNHLPFLVLGEGSLASFAPVISSGDEAIVGVAPGSWAKIRGTNLSTKVTLKGALYPVLSPRLSDSDRRLDFKIDPREKSGIYEIFVTNNIGESNHSLFSVSLVSSPDPSIVNCSTAFVTEKNYPTKGGVKDCSDLSGCSAQNVFVDFCSNTTILNEYYCSGGQSALERYTCPSGCVDGACKKDDGIIPFPTIVAANSVLQTTPGGWAKVRGTFLTGSVYVEGASYSVTSQQVLDGNRRVDFKVDSREKPGNYLIYVVNTTGESNRLPFTILPGTTSSSLSNQLANILASFGRIVNSLKSI
jgi:hypothetical protein